jgi:endonuclease-3
LETNSTAASSPDTRDSATSRRAGTIARILHDTYPDAYELRFSTPFELLIAAVLAVQCTDQRVNAVTPEIFARYPTPEALAEADPNQLVAQLSSLSLYNKKTQQLIAIAKRLAEVFGGAVPERADDLRTLAGVGDKTVALVRGLAFGQDELPVDRHVQRVALRTGVATHQRADVVSQELREILPREQWLPFALTAVQHGRVVCTARNPHCERCPIAIYCPANKASHLPSE